MRPYKPTRPMLLLFFLLAGCMTVTPADLRVKIIDDFLASSIKVLNVTTAVNSGGFMEAQVIGDNNTSLYKKLEYKIEWIDQNGFIIPSILSRWTSFPAYENASFNFKAVAPRTTAVDFKILIRKAN